MEYFNYCKNPWCFRFIGKALLPCPFPISDFRQLICPLYFSFNEYFINGIILYLTFGIGFFSTQYNYLEIHQGC